MIRVTGSTLAELFENAAAAVFDRSFELDGVAPTYSRPIVAPGDSVAELLDNWLAAVREESARAGIVFSSFVVDRLEEGGVQGAASGMPSDHVVTRPRVVRSVRVDGSPVEVADGWWALLSLDWSRPLRSV